MAGFHFVRLCPEEVFPVCSPTLLKGRRALRTPADLKHHTLLHLDRRDGWKQWLEAADAGDVDVSRGPILNQASMAIDAAIDGHGVALARTALAAWDLNAGRLVRPFRQVLAVPYAYWLVCPEATAELPKIATFRRWILAEAEADLKRMSRS